MPQKEHLAFESSTPTFLRRLRGEGNNDSSGSESIDPDRHQIPQVRAKRPRDPAADLDDEPVIVDERGMDVSREEAGIERLAGAGSVAGASGEGEKHVSGGDSAGVTPVDAESEQRRGGKEIVASVGVGRRRGDGPRVIGGGDSHDDEAGEAGLRKPVDESKSTGKGKEVKKETSIDGPASVSASTATSTTDSTVELKAKKNKKNKKIKLSFDDDG